MLVVTILVAAWVVVALIRWIAHLTDLGTLSDALRRTESAALEALKKHRRQPALGARTLTPDLVVPQDARTLTAPESGVLQMIDVRVLAACADGPVWVLRRPGQVVLKGMPLAQFAGDAAPERLADCFVIGDSRTFEQDPGFALIVMAEIGARALSAAVNDSGTAIEVISRLERLLWDYAQAEPAKEPAWPNVFVPAMSARELIDDAFDALARDGAGRIEVSAHLLDALHVLGGAPDADLAHAARVLARRAHAHAMAALTLEADRDRLSSPPAEDAS